MYICIGLGSCGSVAHDMTTIAKVVGFISTRGIEMRSTINSKTEAALRYATSNIIFKKKLNEN